MNPKPTPHSEPHPPPTSAALRAELAKMDVYQWERLALTDAANTGADPEPSADKRPRAWLEAVCCWVLSRM